MTKNEIIKAVEDYRANITFDDYSGRLNLTFEDYKEGSKKYPLIKAVTKAVEDKISDEKKKAIIESFGEVPRFFASVEIIPDDYAKDGYILYVSGGDYYGFYEIDKFLDTFAD